MLSIKKQLDGIKKSPGVYIFRDAKNRVIYIGKAKNLRSRVRSYFIGNKDNRPLIPRIVEKTRKIETIKTNSEIEAILLEAELIKRIKPPLNLRQKMIRVLFIFLLIFLTRCPEFNLSDRRKFLKAGLNSENEINYSGHFSRQSK